MKTFDEYLGIFTVVTFLSLAPPMVPRLSTLEESSREGYGG